MSQKQQAFLNCICKAARQNFQFNHEEHMDRAKIRLRSDIHRVEQADKKVIKAKVLQR
jgi:hypothetical protein